jgi:hypothetical protein
VIRQCAIEIPGFVNVEQGVDDLTGSNEDGVLPNEVRLDDSA